MFTPYGIFKLFHVIAAIAWVGGDIMLLLLAQQVRANGTSAEMSALLARMEHFSKTFFAPLSVVTLLMGIGMAVIGDLFAASWVSLGFLGIFASAGIGMGLLTPQARRLRAIIDTRGKDDPEAVSLGSKMLLWARLDVLVLVIVVAAMVLKPGM